MATVLLVDDDPDCREMFRDVLAPDGYRVLEACNGLDALEICALGPPDVIITDGAMPLMTGRELVLALGTHARWRTIPVIVVSGRDAIQADNVVARFSKPVSCSRLRDAVRACVFARLQVT